MHKLHIDIETFSSVDIKTAGAYKYAESIDFEILLVAYAYDDEPIQIVDLAQGEKLPQIFINDLINPAVEKHAHNATFERICFRAIGYDVPIDQWRCSAVKSTYCGLPLALGEVSKALKLGELGKLSTGRALIKYFCVPTKPTKANGRRLRNFPHHDLEKWELFKEYCINDVEAERAIDNRLLKYKIPQSERFNYVLDQEINDRGILIDLGLVKNAIYIDAKNAAQNALEVKKLTGLENPNSPAQLKKWLGDATGKEIKSLAKDVIPVLIEENEENEVVLQVLKLRQRASKTSIKKYSAMLNCASFEDQRARGLFKFYGAFRTGRWAGRLIQLQNLPRNYLKELAEAREDIKYKYFEQVARKYDRVSDTLSQLIRTAFVPKPGHSFVVSDFSAIEARVIAWLSGEKWRLKVFATHGKIYEASASAMFDVPIELVTKDSEYRSLGKVAELALGFGGSVGALKNMGGEQMGLSEPRMKELVQKWRAANKSIVSFWKNTEASAKQAMKTKKAVTGKQGLVFDFDGKALTIQLPSGRKLFYWNARFSTNRFGSESIVYEGVNQKTKQWGFIDTYGGKMVENIVQAVARDILASALERVDAQGYEIVMHVHDELVCEVLEDDAEDDLRVVNNILGEDIAWAPGLNLNAEGYVTEFYKKD